MSTIKACSSNPAIWSVNFIALKLLRSISTMKMPWFSCTDCFAWLSFSWFFQVSPDLYGDNNTRLFTYWTVSFLLILLFLKYYYLHHNSFPWPVVEIQLLKRGYNWNSYHLSWLKFWVHIRTVQSVHSTLGWIGLNYDCMVWIYT